MTGVQTVPRPKDCHLEIYGSEHDVGQPFEVVCLIDSETGRTIFNRHSVQAALDRLRPAACACGADALIVEDVKKQGALSTFSAGYGYSTVKVKVIRFLQGQTRPHDQRR